MFQAFANHLWQSTLIVVLVAALCHWLRRDGAHVRYWLWWIASLKFLVPFSLLTAIGARLAGDSPVGFVPEIWTFRAEVVARPFAEAPSPGVLLLFVWAAGSMALIARWIAGATRLRALLSRAEPDPTVLVDGSRRIRVYRSSERIEPGIVGIFRPVLLLPRSIDEQLKPAQLEAVLTHEIGHVRRRDNLTSALHMLVEAAFWFHPFVWWIGARLIDERERACDELVVASGHDREIYAEGILDVCEHYAATPLRCAAGISGSDLKRRITQIMRYQRMKSLQLAKKALLGVAALAALVAPLVAGLAIQQRAEAQQVPVSASGEEFLPIVKVAPIYPPRAAARGLEGYVVISYTVNETGSTENFAVVESTSSLFDEASIDSARKYKYRPRLENGVPVAVHGVTTRIIYELEDEELAVNPDAQGAATGADAGSDVEEVRVRASLPE
jgi:TonB family protein